MDCKNFDGAAIITPSEQITVNIIPTSENDKLESDYQTSCLSISTPAPLNPTVSMYSSPFVTEIPVSVSQLSLRSDNKLPTTPLSVTSDYTPVYNSRKMG